AGPPSMSLEYWSQGPLSCTTLRYCAGWRLPKAASKSASRKWPSRTSTEFLTRSSRPPPPRDRPMTDIKLSEADEAWIAANERLVWDDQDYIQAVHVSKVRAYLASRTAAPQPEAGMGVDVEAMAVALANCRAMLASHTTPT